MPLAFDLGAIGAGFFGDKKTNKLNKKEFERQKQLTAKQTGIADYIQELAARAAGTNADIYDPSGGYTRFNPATGRYEYGLGEEQQGIQGASYEEELLRNTVDQQLRRQGLTDFERMRQRSSGRADRALDDIDAARRGIGMVDPNAVAGQLLTSRTGQMNAGYDDAERAARTMQLRTGSSAVGDALTALARDRVRAQASMGTPGLEALEFAEGINTGRNQQNYGVYGQFGDEARNFYDAQFAPSAYEQLGRENLGKQMDFDLSKLEIGMGGAANAGSTVANAQRGQQAGYGAFMANRIASPIGSALSGASNAIDAFGKKIATGGMG